MSGENKLEVNFVLLSNSEDLMRLDRVYDRSFLSSFIDDPANIHRNSKNPNK